MKRHPRNQKSRGLQPTKKARCRSFEENMCKKLYKMKGSMEEKLKKLASVIYETGVESFRVVEKQKKWPREKKGESSNV